MSAARGVIVRRGLWWTVLLVVLSYAAFALSAAGAEVLHQLGRVADVRVRSAPIFFIVHALAGTVALVSGLFQWIPRWRVVSRRHKWIGRAYAIAVAVAGTTALRMAITFDRPVAARLSFAVLALVWLTATGIGVRRILLGDVAHHREWMIRSFALTLFFVSSPLWMSAAEGGPWPYEIAYPIGVTLGWALNLAVAEVWIRRRKAPGSLAGNATFSMLAGGRTSGSASPGRSSGVAARLGDPEIGSPATL